MGAFFAFLVIAAGVVALFASPASTQSGCPGVGVSAVTVDVFSPRPGQRVQGVVTVTGRVSASLAVSRVELQVGRSIVDSQSFPAAPSAEFSLTWNASSAPAGEASLRVVACGQGLGGVLVQGSSTVAVVVGAASSTTGPSTSIAIASSTTVRGTTTTTVSPSTSSSTSSTRTSTTVARTTTTLADPGLVTAGRVVGPAGRLLPGEAAARRRHSHPIWVGVVVGLSGLGGLLASRALTLRRRGVAEEG